MRKEEIIAEKEATIKLRDASIERLTNENNELKKKHGTGLPKPSLSQRLKMLDPLQVTLGPDL